MTGNFDRNLSNEDLLRRRATFLQRVHIDGILLLLLLTLAVGQPVDSVFGQWQKS